MATMTPVIPNPPAAHSSSTPANCFFPLRTWWRFGQPSLALSPTVQIQLQPQPLLLRWKRAAETVARRPSILGNRNLFLQLRV